MRDGVQDYSGRKREKTKLMLLLHHEITIRVGQPHQQVLRQHID